MKQDINIIEGVVSPRSIFFIGIGGIGMSAIARYFIHYGYTVGGYDRVETPITQSLVAQGAQVIYIDDDALIPEVFKGDDCLVVYTPAIPQDNNVRLYYEGKGITFHKRSEILGFITAGSKALCVAGTHGKTTTSTLLAHLLSQSHVGANAFLGGVSLNHDSNLLLDERSPYVVVEADEYDRSFHRLRPFMSIITSTKPDHLDIYGDAAAFTEAFEYFASLTTDGGLVLMHDKETNITPKVGPGTRVMRYGSLSTSEYRYDNIRYEGGELFFDWYHPDGVYKDMTIGTPIEINVVNATAALAVAKDCGCAEAELRSGLSSFRGVHRRFERVLTSPQYPILLDDYAHHPEEIEASLSSIKKLYPDKEITVVFQPHLYSRTADFQREFGESLSQCDDIILLDIYPARELPIPGISSHSILKYIDKESKCVVSKADLIQELSKHHFDVLVMMGAGDIEFEVPKVKEYLMTKKYQ
ncbi:UDP-N-acetylmuramate--L-alanine ligase [Porphyromonas sp.]|uniref:UDP-N-acetylmuramate--L-alanine ligase n=1 Tax=Porphyromonas sp. TaxID=1924944 RepID=UPI0026DD27DD|nr:UDP-N-acetylmuramate--L-alanine ligase [Porphyromonas sp.]MDO4770337.1 UDP-N-acetylmuramate--L-alanine ligase [Porphyromonas sp.]